MYQIDFSLPYMVVENLKQKDYLNVIGIITGTRLGEFVKLIGPGVISYDTGDMQRIHPIVTLLDKFNRNKTNCIVFDLPINYKNFGYYDKLFIYYVGNNKSGGFGLVIYNSKTNKSISYNNIGKEYDDITRKLNQLVNFWQTKDLYKYSQKKSDALHKRNGLDISDCPTYKDYLKLNEEIIERIDIYYKGKDLFLKKYFGATNG